jgi:hypothetical protein
VAIDEKSSNPKQAAVRAEHTAGGTAVQAVSATGSGVVSNSTSGRGISGWSDTNYGVSGDSRTFPGVRGTSVSGRGVEGWTTTGEAGVWGIGPTTTGVRGASESGDGVVGSGRRGVVGLSDSYQGVYGWSRENAGVVGESVLMHAVYGVSLSSGHAGVYGGNRGGGMAGQFDGDVRVNGVVTARDCCLINADGAEDFDAEEPVEPGMVVVLATGESVCVSRCAYDRRVAGVVSGAGIYAPAIRLDHRASAQRRVPVALFGKVWCKADAHPGPIALGDLLTTSATPGHAMKATDPARAFGAVIGKALAGLADGTGLLPILVALQ